MFYNTFFYLKLGKRNGIINQNWLNILLFYLKVEKTNNNV